MSEQQQQTEGRVASLCRKHVLLVSQKECETCRQKGKRYWRITVEMVDGEVETYLDKIVIAEDEDEAEAKAIKLCKEYAAGGTEEDGVYFAPAGYPAYRPKDVDELRMLEDAVTRWL
ncbi:MAG: hypothetical protein ACE5NN_03300 [Candidatus Bathyarchaeia archaeon]